MPANLRRQTWFHVDTGLAVEKGSGLGNVIEVNTCMDNTIPIEQLNYTWIWIDDVNWIQCQASYED
jgi:hypothetical protein